MLPIFDIRTDRVRISTVSVQSRNFMPITFTVNKSKNYFICKPVGIITGSESLESWKIFLQGEDWLPGLGEFTDLSEANMSEFTTDAYKKRHLFTK